MPVAKIRVVLPGLFGIALAAGCVKKSTYDAVLDELAATQGELEAEREAREDKENEIAELEEAIEAEREELAAREAEIDRKEEQLERLAAEGAATEEELEEIAEMMAATEEELEELRAQRDAAQARVDAYRELRDQLAALVDAGDLQVEFRDGQMVLQLPSAVLFPSGRASLRRDGRESLQDVLDILLDFRERQFMIAGHTDNVPIGGGRFEDNWDLSTSRATSVVNYMVNAGFDPDNLVAAGFGEHAPVASNDTEAGRAENRRIEIILLPDLSELPTFEDEDLAGGAGAAAES